MLHQLAMEHILLQDLNPGPKTESNELFIFQLWVGIWFACKLKVDYLIKTL